MNQLERTITSLEVSEMVCRRHDQVMRDIRTVIGHLREQSKIEQFENAQLGAHKNVESYFIESTYTNTQNKQQPCYLLTKKGCELYSTRMTGAKGTQFAVAYIERFNQMEEHIKNEELPQNSMELALQAALKHEKEINGIKTDVDYLKNTMRIDSLEQQEIQQAAKKSVIQALGGKDSVAYREINKKAFSAFWNEFKQYFKIPRYGDLPKVKLDDAFHFIKLWRPSTALQMEIDSCNSQMQF